MNALSYAEQGRRAEAGEYSGSVPPTVESPPVPSQNVGDQGAANHTGNHPHPDALDGFGLRSDDSTDHNDRYSCNVASADECAGGQVRLRWLNQVAHDNRSCRIHGRAE